MIRIFTDGGARGNPGPAAIGVHIIDDQGSVLARIGKKIGIATNNVAEYTAVLEAMQWLLDHSDTWATQSDIVFFLDSQLAVRQLTGLYKIKNPALLALVTKIEVCRRQLSNARVSFSHVPREENKLADALVNMALDNRT